MLRNASFVKKDQNCIQCNTNTKLVVYYKKCSPKCKNFKSLCFTHTYKCSFCIEHLFDKTMRIRVQMLKSIQQLYKINNDIISLIFKKIFDLHFV